VRIVVLDSPKPHSEKLVHLDLPARSACIPPRALDNPLVALEAAALRHHLEAHMFASSWSAYGSGVVAELPEETLMSSWSVTGLVVELRRIYSRMQHLADCWGHDHTHSASYRSAAPAGIRPSLREVWPEPEQFSLSSTADIDESNRGRGRLSHDLSARRRLPPTLSSQRK
jgi:hypothetical protein